MTSGIRLPLLPFVAAGLQYGAGVDAIKGTPFERGAVVVSHAVVAVWLIVNTRSHVGWRRLGVALALLGWLLNMAVMVPNGGMPVSRSSLAAVASGPAAADVDVTDGHLSKHVPLTDDTVLAALADVHPLPALRIVYSDGDVLLAAGLLVLLGAIAFEGLGTRRVAAWTPALLTSQRSSPEADATS